MKIIIKDTVFEVELVERKDGGGTFTRSNEAAALGVMNDALKLKRRVDGSFHVTGSHPLSSEVLSAEEAVKRLLTFVGEEPTRGGLLETPMRVLRAWEEWTWGYTQDPKAVMKTFEDGAESVDEMILVSHIPFWSHCEHHMTPFFGHAHVAYIPDGRIVGLSKLARVVDIFARRLQVQERLTTQVADCIAECLTPKGVAVVFEARHFCMESRGIKRVGAITTTSALRGAFLEQAPARAEFYSMIGRKQ